MKLLGYIAAIILLMVISTEAKAQASDTVCAFSHRKTYRVIPTPGSTYFWSVECGTIVSANANADSITVDWCQNPGTYQVKVIERTRQGCWGDTVKTWVIVNGQMHLSINGPTEICEGEPVVLEASGAVNYKWNTGETNSSIVKRPTDTVVYKVIGYSLCDKDSATIKVKVYPRPKASFTYKPKAPKVNDTIFFHYTGTGANQWVWYFGDKNSLGGQVTDPQYSFNEKGDKLVTLVATNNAGCTDTLTYKLHVAFDSKIFVPNAFTPNGDGDNDVFRAIGWNLKTIHMHIYNRWGEQIFESNGLNDGWDGTYKGQNAIEGVYMYKIEAEALDGENYYLNGSVTVLR
jgi:gliding motility-associated-like protein